MSIPSHADVIVLNRRPGPRLRPGDVVPERQLLRAPDPGEVVVVVVRNVVTSVDPYHLRMLRGSSEVTSLTIGEPVPANSVGVVVRSDDPGVPVGKQVATTRWQSYATTEIAPHDEHSPHRRATYDTAAVGRSTPLNCLTDAHPSSREELRRAIAAALGPG